MGRATTNDATTNERYNELFLSIKSGCYNESGGILFIMESSILVFTREVSPRGRTPHKGETQDGNREPAP